MAKSQSKKHLHVTKRDRPKSPGRVTLLEVMGDPIEILKKLTGSKVQVVTRAKMIAKIAKKDPSLRRFGYYPVKTAAAQATAINQKAFEPDARAQALLEGVRIAQEDLRTAGGAYDLQQVRTLMQGVSRQAVDKRVQEGSLLAVPGPSNRRSYPTLQFNPDGTIVEGLKAVCAALPTGNPWTILNFLAQPDDRLQGRKPIDVLKAGNVELVIEAARRLGQQGA